MSIRASSGERLSDDRRERSGETTKEKHPGLKAFCIFWFAGVPLAALLAVCVGLLVGCIIGKFGWLPMIGAITLVALILRSSSKHKEAAKHPRQK